MTTVGFHASHEQFTPAELLRLVRLAEQAGFRAGMCSDHFNPWTPGQGQSGFAWAWLGAALQATGWTHGVVTAPGQRYHPAIVAQAFGTLSQMFPGRFWCALGTGQYLNEHITGERWPTKGERRERLKLAVDVMRALWAGEEVSLRSPWFVVEEARLYTRPEAPPQVFGAALTEETARWVGSWADGLITVQTEPARLRQLVTAFREGGGDGKPLRLQVHVAYAPTGSEARHAAMEHWRTNVYASDLITSIKTPQQFEVLASKVRPEDLDASVRISSDLQQHVAWLQEYVELGFDHLYLHEAGLQQERFLEAFGQHVLPALSPPARG
ncbi:MAG: putative 5,10-methylenetetrahydromethanopterin reductase [Ramlibacter sp.]|jgi:coenzyme F420-dependent glucose-6-phosphate dehydrogenase|nr:putative 5,10-methylenetetrahydromethanopterin reductase [Ramlibacter sp.]